MDLKNHKAVLFDPENPSSSTGTTVTKLGQAVASVLLHPEETKNRFIYVSSFTITRKELIASLEKITGDKWATSTESTYDLEKLCHEKLAQGNMAGILDLLIAGLHRKGIGADYGFTKSDNEMLGLPQEDLNSVLKECLASA